MVYWETLGYTKMCCGILYGVLRKTKIGCSIQRYPTIYTICTMRHWVCYHLSFSSCPWPQNGQRTMTFCPPPLPLGPTLLPALHNNGWSTMGYQVRQPSLGYLLGLLSRIVLELGYCTLSLSWLAGHQLDLYQFLAPNAYPRLEVFVDTIERRVPSQVYEVMPLFEWCDGSHKYLHVDVPLMEDYQVCLCEEIDQSAFSNECASY